MVQLSSIRRYPVKAMGGESLHVADVDYRGLRGDRAYAVTAADGRLASAKNTRRFRRHDPVLGYTAVTTPRGVLVHRGAERWLAGDPALDARLSQECADDLTVRAEGATPHFDSGPVSVIGSATLSQERRRGVDADARRLRCSLMLLTEEPYVEESWIGRTLRIGTVRLRLTRRIVRCRTIDLAQDGLTETTNWLSQLGDRDACLGVYAEVLEPGRLAVADPVEVA